MNNEITTEKLALFVCDFLNRESEKNNFTNNWSFHFDLKRDELPENFNTNDFFKIITDNFNVNDLRIEDLEYKLRVLGRVFVPKKWTYSGQMEMNEEEFNRLKRFANGESTKT